MVEKVRETGAVKALTQEERKTLNAFLLDASGQNYSRREIANYLHVNRSVVIGLCYRLGIRDTKAQLSHKNNRILGKTKAKPKPEPRKVAPRKIQEPVIAFEEINGRVTILSARAHHCRWVQEDGYLCAHTTIEGKSWCPHHFGVVYTEGRSRVRHPRNIK